jgi:hypothetical protein
MGKSSRDSQEAGRGLYLRYGHGGSDGDCRFAIRTRLGRRARDNGDVTPSHTHAPFLDDRRGSVRGADGRVNCAAAGRHHQAGRLRHAPRPVAGRIDRGRRAVPAARLLERAAGVAAVARAAGPPRDRQRRVAERDTRIQDQGRGRGLEGAGRVGRLPAVAGADRGPRNRPAVPPARPARRSCPWVHPEARAGRPAAGGRRRAHPGADRRLPVSVVCARAASSATAGDGGSGRRAAAGRRQRGPRASPCPGP